MNIQEIQKSFTVILLASGQGSRMESELPKQYYNIPSLDITVLEYIYNKLAKIFKHIIITVPSEGDVPDSINKLSQNKYTQVIRGGDSRQESAYIASQEANTEYLLIHDVARPLVNINDIERLLNNTLESKASILASKVTDTIKQSEKSNNNLIEKTVSRDNLWKAETPQGFETRLYKQAQKYIQENNIQVTDDASILEKYQHPVHITESQYINFKITTEKDFELFLKLI